MNAFNFFFKNLIVQIYKINSNSDLKTHLLKNKKIETKLINGKKLFQKTKNKRIT